MEKVLDFLWGGIQHAISAWWFNALLIGVPIAIALARRVPQRLLYLLRNDRGGFLTEALLRSFWDYALSASKPERAGDNTVIGIDMAGHSLWGTFEPMNGFEAASTEPLLDGHDVPKLKGVLWC